MRWFVCVRMVSSKGALLPPCEQGDCIWAKRFFAPLPFARPDPASDGSEARGRMLRKSPFQTIPLPALSRKRERVKNQLRQPCPKAEVKRPCRKPDRAFIILPPQSAAFAAGKSALSALFRWRPRKQPVEPHAGAAPFPDAGALPAPVQSWNGSRIRMTSSRSGLVETSATGVSMSSSMRRTYLTASAGSWAHDRAPTVEPFQPSKVS
jgi:hypothetical protein